MHFQALVKRDRVWAIDLTLKALHTGVYLLRILLWLISCLLKATVINVCFKILKTMLPIIWYSMPKGHWKVKTLQRGGCLIWVQTVVPNILRVTESSEKSIYLTFEPKKLTYRFFYMSVAFKARISIFSKEQM